MSKKLIVAFRKPFRTEIPLLKDNEETIILGLNSDAIIGLEELDLEYCTFKNYFEKKEYEDLYDEVIDSIRIIGDSKIDNKNILRDFLRYGDFALWDIWEFHFAFQLYPHFLFYKLCIKIILNEKPSEIVILGEKNKLENIVKLIAETYNINLYAHYPSMYYRFKKRLGSLFNYFFIKVDININ